jgi:glycosyltransferase involved in cell wall biosynthesis
MAPIADQTTPPAPAAPPPGSEAAQLLVFADDWGRHPSSCQHLVRKLLDRHRVLWVNTIGTRPPRLSREDLGKGTAKLRQWLGGRAAPHVLPANLRVLNPLMYPGFRARWHRRLNAALVGRAVDRALGPRRRGERRVAITTIAITADLVGRLDVDRWVYYCVDDFSVWPGLDGRVLDELDRALVRRVDRVVCVSETLRRRLGQLGANALVLTHGIDLAHWRQVAAAADTGAARSATDLPRWWPATARPILLFWGVVDRRLDTACCRALAAQVGTVVLVGPCQSPDPDLAATPRVCMPGPVPYQVLPTLAAAADVLVMPYADLPVTRAIQPLKLKEYLATGRPVVVRNLPATAPWGDAADVVNDAAGFVSVVRQRLEEGVSDAQRQARTRLDAETWDHKARTLEQVLLAD